MIARMLAAVALLFLTAAAAPDWTKAVRATPEGGRLVGNPAARVKLVELAAYTCPRCAHFAAEASVPLAQAIRAGKLAVELRPVVFDQVGLSAAIIARCVPAQRFWAVNEALYARQPQWHAAAHAYADQNAGELSRYAMLDQLQELAVKGGIAAAAGLTEAQVTACFANQPLVDGTLRATDAAGAIAPSTPTFLIGNQKYTGLTWATLYPKLRAAGLN